MQREHLLANKRSILIQNSDLENGVKVVSNSLFIPRLTNEELLDRYSKVKPIAFYDGSFYKIKDFNFRELCNRSYLGRLSTAVGEKIDIDNYELVSEFPCYLEKGKRYPTIEQVLEQFPTSQLKKADVFWLVKYLGFIYDKKYKKEILDAGYTQACVKALRLKKK